LAPVAFTDRDGAMCFGVGSAAVVVGAAVEADSGASAVVAVDYQEEEAQVAVGEILNKSEEKRLVELIRSVEKNTTGEIRVHITKSVSAKGVMTDAARAFTALGMDKTADRNGVLLYIAVKDHALACLGDKGIHEKIGDDGWKKIIDDLRAYFAKGDYFAGLHRAIEGIGETLKTHFPGAGGINELSDEISSN
jgi:uncharacterized membrane protein